MFLWTDLETTGLDPIKDVPLSIGIILTDDQFREIARCEWVVGWPATHPAIVGMCDFVRTMHTKNGLLAKVHAVHADGFGLEAAEFVVSMWLASRVGLIANIKERPPYAGNTVAFDKAFIERYMPKVAAYYNYRCLDVSTLKLIALAIAPGAKAWNAAQGEAEHTPLKDLEASLREFAHWRRVLFNTAIGCCPYFAVTHAGPPIIDGVPSTYEPCTLTPGHEGKCQP